MFKSRTPLSAKTAFIALSTLTFFFSAQVSLTIYIDSSFLKETIANTPSLIAMKIWDDPDHLVGALYTFASVITIIGLFFAPRLLRKYGNYQWTITALLLHIALLVGLGLFNSAWLIIPLFSVETALISILYFNIDIFLERYSKDADTGAIRGLFLMIGSIAWLLPPMFAGEIIESSGFSMVYLTGAGLMVPTIFIMMRFFRDFEDLAYEDMPLLPSIGHRGGNPDLRHILFSNFFLHFFYAWMIIYTPIFLHDHVGFSYEKIGLLLTCALSAFVFMPYPTGWIADKLLGEKELLVAGFFLMGATCAFVPTLAENGAGFLAWAGLLLVGRIGAATVETMNEAYFFKKIDGGDAGLIGYFRRSRPMAFIVAPIVASLLLQFKVVEIRGLFVVLAFVMAIAICFPLRLRDTK